MSLIVDPLQAKKSASLLILLISLLCTPTTIVVSAIDPSVREHPNYEDEVIVPNPQNPNQKQERTLGQEDWGEYLNYTQGLATFNENDALNNNFNSTTSDIIDGSDADFKPWVVHFASKICMGALLSADRILTSATCIQVGDVPSFVRIGPTTQFNGVLGTVECAKTHPQYFRDGSRIENDLAILKLKAPIDTTTRPPIPFNQDTTIPNSDGQQLFAYGFGFDDFESFPSRLQELEYESISTTGTCASAFPSGVIQDGRHLCVQPEREDRGLCSGDSGAPLVDSDSTDDATLIGIASFTYGNCANRDYADVYVPVAHYTDWILNQLEDNSCDFDPPTMAPTVTVMPSSEPSFAPTMAPTVSAKPSAMPSVQPSMTPSVSVKPSGIPSATPSTVPSESSMPSLLPSVSPSSNPTEMPSSVPSQAPTQAPTTIIEDIFDCCCNCCSQVRSFVSNSAKRLGSFVRNLI